jgi:hypothetical protein
MSMRESVANAWSSWGVRINILENLSNLIIFQFILLYQFNCSHFFSFIENGWPVMSKDLVASKRALLESKVCLKSSLKYTYVFLFLRVI